MLLISCNTVKSTQKSISSGNYNQAINISVEKLRNNKTNKKSKEYILLLKEAFAKANKRDLEKIVFLKKQKNPENFETIYNSYVSLKQRQQKIAPLLPLQINEKPVNFYFNSFDDDIIEYMDKASDYLYTKAKNALSTTNSKLEYRAIYDDLNYIEKINPNYKDVRDLLEKARDLGTDFVHLYVTNSSETVLPKRLEEDLLNIDTYGLNDFWTVYQTNQNTNINYDYSLELAMKNIAVSPEQIREKELIKEKEVKSGFKYLLDEKGKRVKDSLGKEITIDNMIKVQCKFYQFTQFKAASMTGQVIYHNKRTNQVEQDFPIQSEFIFENIYANYKGDKRALEESFLDLLEVKAVPFPTNEQMVYSLGEDIKLNLKTIINQNTFRN
jgi:hypothetical protein